MGAGRQDQGFPVAVEAFHDLCTGRHDGQTVAVQAGQAGHEEAHHPDRPPVENRGMSNDADFTRTCCDVRVLFLLHAHGSSFPTRVIGARPHRPAEDFAVAPAHTVLRVVTLSLTAWLKTRSNRPNAVGRHDMRVTRTSSGSSKLTCSEAASTYLKQAAGVAVDSDHRVGVKAAERLRVGSDTPA